MSDPGEPQDGAAPDAGNGRPGDAAPGRPGDAAPDAAAPAASPPAPPAPAVRSGPGGAGRRILAAAVTLPWLVGYGFTGAWAVTRGVRALAAGVPHVDAGYGTSVSPWGLIWVGVLLLAGFATLLAAAVLLLASHRGRGAWLAVCSAALALTAGSVWAAVRGDLHSALWLLFFFGVLYAAIVALVVLLRMPRRRGRGTIAAP